MHFLQKFQWQIPPHKMADSHYPILKFRAPQSALQRQFYPKPKLELKGFGYFWKSRGTVFGVKCKQSSSCVGEELLLSIGQLPHFFGGGGTAPFHWAAGVVNGNVVVNVFKPF